MPYDSYADFDHEVIVTLDGVSQIEPNIFAKTSDIARKVGSGIIRALNYVDGLGDETRKYYRPTSEVSTRLGMLCIGVFGAAVAYRLGPDLARFIAASPEYVHSAMDTISEPIEPIINYTP